MTRSNRQQSFLLIAAMALTGGCATSDSAPVSTEDLSSVLGSTLSAYQLSDLVYTGKVFGKDAPANKTLYTYERRVRSSTSAINAAHITNDTNNDVIIIESSKTTSDYSLMRFETINAQSAYRGTATLTPDGQRVDYELTQNGKTRQKSESISEPLVSGPSLFGFVRHHWQQLVNGEAIVVRFIVMSEMKTYGFRIRHSASKDGLTQFSITPTNWLIRFFVSPLTITYDSNARVPVRYEGLVPPTVEKHGKHKQLIARVEYTMNAADYR